MKKLPYQQAVLDNINEQVYVRDLDMNIIYINPAAEKLTEWTLQESLGKKCYEVFGDKKLECRDVCPVEKAITDRSSVLHHEGELIARNGDIRKMRVSISPMQDEGNVTGAIVVMQDVTDFKALEDSHIKTLIKMEKVQASLKKSEFHLKQAQTVASVGSWHLDISNDILTWSKEIYRTFGVAEGTQLNTAMFLNKVHPEDQEMVESVWQAALNGNPYNIEHRILIDDEVLWVHEKAQILFDRQGKPFEAIGTVQNITKRKQSLDRAKQLNSLNEDLLRIGSLSEKMGVITDKIVKIFKADFARIWIIRSGDLCDSTCNHSGVTKGPHVCKDRDRCLHLIASSGRYTHSNGGHQRVPFGAYKIGRIASGEESKFLTNDVLNDPRIHDQKWARSLGLVSFAGYRLLSANGGVIGVLALFSDKKISPEENALIENLSGITAQVIQTAKAEDALQESENNFRTFFDTINDFLFILDGLGNIQVCNQTVLKRLGYSQEELYNKPVLFVHPENRREEAGQIVAEMLQGQRTYCPVPLITKMGDLIPVETYVSEGVWDGKPSIFGVSKDITALKLSEDKFSKAFHSNPAIAGLSDLKTGEFIEVNPAFYEKLGFTPNETIGKRASKIVRMDAEFREKTLRKLKKQGNLKNEETIIYTKNGTPLNVLLSSEIIEIGGRKHNFTNAVDITDHRQAEKALKESEEKFRAIFEQAAVGVALTSTSTGKLIQINRKYCDIVGYSEEELRNLTFQELTHPDDLQADSDKMQDLIEGRIHDFSMEKRYLAPDGSTIWIDLTVSPMWKIGDPPTFHIAVIEDITKRKLMETEVRTLSGLLPICASCKNIRDDKGYWNQIESYIHKHSEAEFSHSICPECAKKLYPDLDYPD